ncbi:VOC family protein [Pseudomonas aeruginosa]|jgi:2-polyprenyl-6-hydroxyphenyl methylase/3-demethylubiquinone-9 3-methyltransferase|nr:MULTISPECIES: VOC family protein [Pseudomonadaceae]MBN0133861.1 VOC family protein [Pseudomonas aeruginosa]MCG0425201.1 VOC family protein [Pseudomonas aeruginosa]MCL8299499.1 VOC family protein [Pseudomonas mosselii]MCL8339881.1 VOC family protein [Pseudomonas mosselii]MCR3832880.1 VOC family protein [Pseudomonas aeruginosa]
MSCLGLNDDPVFQYKEPLSFQVATDDQAETDHL